MSQIGKKILRQREKQGMSRAQLSKASGVSESYIEKIEYGSQKNISLEIIQRIAKAFGVPFVLWIE